jgi:hypothetical protein
LSAASNIGAALADRSRAAQGLPEKIENADALAKIAGILAERKSP